MNPNQVYRGPILMGILIDLNRKLEIDPKPAFQSNEMGNLKGLIKLYKSVNKSISKPIESITPKQAQEDIVFYTLIHDLLTDISDYFTHNVNPGTLFYQEFLPVLLETVTHIEEIIEALELFAYEDIMMELDSFING